jgi:hypothetical protein
LLCFLPQTLTWLRISMSAATMKNHCVNIFLCCNSFCAYCIHKKFNALNNSFATNDLCIFIYFFLVALEGKLYDLISREKRNNAAPTPRYSTWGEKKGRTFCRHGTLHDGLGKKEFESRLKKISPLTHQVAASSRCGSTGTAATAPGKMATAWRCVPIQRRLPQPSSQSGRQGDADGNGCTATKRRLPVFPSGLQRSGSDDPSLAPDPRLGTSALQTRWSGNTVW